MNSCLPTYIPISSYPLIPIFPVMQAENRQSLTQDLDYQTSTGADPRSYPPTQSNQPHPAFQVQLQSHNALFHTIDTTSPQTLPTIDSPHAPTPTPLSAGLCLQTDAPAKLQPHHPILYSAAPTVEPHPQQTTSATGVPVRSSSVRSILSTSQHRRSSLSPASAVSSPGIGPVVDITPLPSPTVSWGSTGLWKRWKDHQEMQDSISEAGDLSNSLPSLQDSNDFAHLSPQIEHKSSSIGRDAQIFNINASAHARNRSLSNSLSSAFQPPRSPSILASDAKYPLHEETFSPPGKYLHREEYLAVKRGLTLPVFKPLTPPTSTRDTDSSGVGSAPPSPPAIKKTPTFYEARLIRSGKLKRWREIGYLGGGAFSTVMLAVSARADDENKANPSAGGFPTAFEDVRLDPKNLVAVKICEHGPAGGADEKRVEISLERELDILKSIDHPCLAHLKAVSILDQRAFLMLSYCPGGDLYLLASTKPKLLIPSLIRRIFTELISAVRHLHSQYIVHRDIKLESLFSS